MSTTMIQIIAGVGVVIILAIIIWRRKSKASK
ncbi:MAG: LPXTG cell wall anchor domain-containing protein [Terriglobia bacterium]|jgi:LPXTG-motif cell wall-anchored protein